MEFRELTSVLGGIGLLIALYLIIIKGPTGAASTAQALTASAVDAIGTLQGNAVSVSFPSG
jgi:divalent metal cation (Fe/Co/Zn/Cd) transporter